MDPQDKDRHRCPACQKSYKRREHLQRHSATHSAARPHRCTQCDGAFQRLDVLKRHARTCVGRASGLVPLPSRRRACDLCVHQKKACSGGTPCNNCERQAVACNYGFAVNPNHDKTVSDKPSTSIETGTGGESRESAAVGVTDDGFAETDMMLDVESSFGVAGMGLGSGSWPLEDAGAALLFSASPEFNLSDPSAVGSSWFDFLSLVSDAPGLDDPSQADDNAQHASAESKTYSFKFLDTLTSHKGLLETFDCGTPELRQETVANLFRQQSPGSAFVFPGPPPGVEGEFGLANSPAPFANDSQCPAGRSSHNPLLQEPLLLQIHQIVVRAREVMQSKSRNSIVTDEWSVQTEQDCLNFFSPQRIRKFICLYWTIWHPNVNIMHYPTFDAVTAKPVLVAAMAIIGACMSPEPPDKEDATKWLNCVEEMVFTDDDLCSDPLYTLENGGALTPALERKIQALQAAYIVCLFQNWEGTDTSKRRIRRVRFASLIAAARDIGIPYARHPVHDGQASGTFSWRDFVVKEQFVRILAWVFLLDHAFVIFNNLPPRMVIREMTSHVAWPESCFQAATARECEAEIHAWTARSPFLRNLTICDAIEMVCKGNVGEQMHKVLADLGPLNLFAIVSAFHVLIFQHQNIFIGDAQLTAVRHGLSNWKCIWEIYSATYASTPPHNLVVELPVTTANAWRRIGFMRYSPEYWLLASVIVDKLTIADSEDARNKATAGHDTGSSPGGSSSSDRILTQYDQTSMHQVNELISDFKQFQINRGGY